MRRRRGALLPLEVDILEASIEAAREGEEWLHGYAFAKRISEGRDSKRLTAHGTLYKALGRLDDSGLLEHRWEDPAAALEAGRPRRRLYRITGLGRQACAADTSTARAGDLRPGVVAP